MEQMTYVKYLGLTIDCNLNWKKLVHKVSNTISRGIGILSKLRHFVTNHILTRLYFSLVQFPFLTYGLIVWGNTYTTTLKHIGILQKKKGSMNNYIFQTRCTLQPFIFTIRLN